MPSKVEMGVSKNRGIYPKMDGFSDGKPIFKMDDLGGKPPIFGNTNFCMISLFTPFKNWVVATQIFFIFTPLFGEDEPILTNIFQRG